ncbi:C40 family peptidase [Saccharopolyspora sp. NPDC000359]|uniref:C40 family peptidase n=1 Tax=Saccharopolyspora sp. NPDC000359 TaxID=3154251 RepID=UPI003327F243
MRRVMLFLGLPVLVIAGIVTCALVVVISIPRFPFGPTGLCLPLSGQAEASGAGQASALTAEQRAIAARIIEIGQQRGLPPRAAQVAIQAGKTESNLTNVYYGDRDSLGVFQMRPSMGWGTPQQVTDVDYAINKFYDVLLEVPGWEQMRPGEAAQRVERSAFPHRYHKWEQLALELLSGAGISDPSGCSTMLAGATSGLVDRAIRFARDQLGDDYVWGANGPDTWDCSSLTQAAWRAAGVSLPRVSRQQFHAGHQLPLQQAVPGDLVFWSYDPHDPGAIYHVGLYLGDRQVLHAPQPGDQVKISPLWDGGHLVPTVTRPGPA